MSRAPETLPRAAHWTDRAACTDADVDPEIFYPVGQGPDALNDRDEAKAICGGCPSQAACLQHALTAPEEHGMWGGLDEVERRKMRRRTGRHGGARHLAPCGTTAALRRHQRRDEPIDDACREAGRLAWQARADAA